MSETTQFHRGALTFDVRDGGPPEGEAVVLLHGFPQDSTSWTGVEPVLHAAGLRTLAPDQRGYSPGARPRGRRAYTSDELADDVLALIDEAGLASAHVVGHDWGGAVGWTLAGRNPERVRSLTVLSTPHPGAMKRAWTSSTQGLKSWYMLAIQVPLGPELVIPRTLVPMLVRTGLARDRAEHYAQRMAEPGALTAALNWYRGLPFSLRSPQHRSKVPTTYIWGRRDPFLGRAAAEATAAYVTSDYRFVEVDGGHWLPETHAEQVGALIVERAASRAG
jgi:pimeloyl-ACP methyl ester carboxylesterase